MKPLHNRGAMVQEANGSSNTSVLDSVLVHVCVKREFCLQISYFAHQQKRNFTEGTNSDCSE